MRGPPAEGTEIVRGVVGSLRAGGLGLAQPGEGVVERTEDMRRVNVRRSEEWGVIIVGGRLRERPWRKRNVEEGSALVEGPLERGLKRKQASMFTKVGSPSASVVQI